MATKFKGRAKENPSNLGKMNIFACRVVKYCNRLPFKASSVPENALLKISRLVYIPKTFIFKFRPKIILFGELVPARSLNASIRAPQLPVKASMNV